MIMNEAKKKIMHPERAARFLSTLGVYLLVGVLIMRVISLVMTTWQTRMGLENTITPPTLPTIGQFHLSSNGKQVIFTRQIGAKGKPDWFYMPLEGGPVGMKRSVGWPAVLKSLHPRNPPMAACSRLLQPVPLAAIACMFCPLPAAWIG
jgi:hypothetical protein